MTKQDIENRIAEIKDALLDLCEDNDHEANIICRLVCEREDMRDELYALALDAGSALTVTERSNGVRKTVITYASLLRKIGMILRIA